MAAKRGRRAPLIPPPAATAVLEPEVPAMDLGPETLAAEAAAQVAAIIGDPAEDLANAVIDDGLDGPVGQFVPVGPTGNPVPAPAEPYFDPDLRPKRTAQRARYADGWNGHSTTFVLGHPVMQNGINQYPRGEDVGLKVVSGAHPDEIILGEGVKVSYRCSRGLDGLWRGPDAIHVMDLYRRGQFDRTAPYRARERHQAAIDVERAVWESQQVDTDPQGNPVIQPPMLSLAQPDAQALYDLHGRMIGSGPEDMRRREQQAARIDVREAQRVWPGAEAPGSHRAFVAEPGGVAVPR